ncbi:MAG TPA: hypothetical protein VJW77_17505 [Terriglobia bacterium]|nr:hypothetical protein [Terriglobia bacterium]
MKGLEQEAERTLRHHRNALEAVARELSDRETPEAAEILRLLDRQGMGVAERGARIA